MRKYKTLEEMIHDWHIDNVSWTVIYLNQLEEIKIKEL